MINKFNPIEKSKKEAENRKESLENGQKNMRIESSEEAMRKKVEKEVILNSPENLRKLYEIFNKKYEFKKGELVKWKLGMKNRRFPLENLPAIVVEKLENPIFDESQRSGSPYFREPLDIIIGIVDDEGVFLTFYSDSRRFEPYSKK